MGVLDFNYEIIKEKTVRRFRKKLDSFSRKRGILFRFRTAVAVGLLLSPAVFFVQYILFHVPAYAQTPEKTEYRELDWDLDSGPVRMTGRAAVFYCSKKGKKLPDMRELSDEICRFRNPSGHWTSYVYAGGSRVFCVCLKSGGPVCSDQKESRKAYVRCVN